VRCEVAAVAGRRARIMSEMISNDDRNADKDFIDPAVVKRRRTADADASALDGLSQQLQSVSLAISAAMDRGTNSEGAPADSWDGEDDVAMHAGGMDELRRWYQTEVFAVSDAQQQRWEERRWAFLGQLQHALRNPLTHTVFAYRIDVVDDGASGLSCEGEEAAASITRNASHLSSAFGGLLFVGRSRYNDIVVADETASRVHCIIVRSAGTVGVFDGWSSYGTVTLARGRKDRPCFESGVDNRRPLMFDEGESFTLRVGKNATINFPGYAV